MTRPTGDAPSAMLAAAPQQSPGGEGWGGTAILRLIEEKEAMRERAVRAEGELELWRSGRCTLSTMPDGHPCIMHHPEDPNAEIRDSETGELLFPAVKAPFRVIDGVCVCVARGDGPEGCGLCNETGKPPGSPSSASEGVG